ncbi:MAG: hypothetical protein RIC30_09485 [Marinoscillum sp.]|uniref:hypothetical protein n=1 Tax=Marinoscillum sp. TaxID=2024838 RepID=UPI0032F0EC9A
MKLKAYNKENLMVASKGLKPSIRFTAKGGKILLSAGAVRELKLKPGVHRVVLLQDEDKPENWYLKITDKSDANAFDLSESNGAKRSIVKSVYFNNTDLSVKVMKSLGKLSESSVSVKLGIEPEELEGMTLYPIVTKVIL